MKANARAEFLNAKMQEETERKQELDAQR